MPPDVEQAAAEAELNEDARPADGAAEAENTGQDEAAGEERTAVEAEARKLGWKPEEEWKGNKTGWVDADAFLDKLSPTRLRETIDRQHGEVQTLRSELARERQEFSARLERIDKMNEAALKRQKSQILSGIKAQRKAAAEAGDMEAIDDIDAYEEKVRDEFAEEEKQAAPKPEKQAPAQADPTVDAWVKANPAIAYSGPKWQAAIAFFSESEALNPNASIADHLAHVESRINEAWPGTVRAKGGKANGQAETQAKASPPQIEGGARQANKSARAKGWSDIPADEQKILKRHVSEGLYKDEADAAKTYWR